MKRNGIRHNVTHVQVERIEVKEAEILNFILIIQFRPSSLCLLTLLSFCLQGTFSLIVEAYHDANSTQSTGEYMYFSPPRPPCVYTLLKKFIFFFFFNSSHRAHTYRARARVSFHARVLIKSGITQDHRNISPEGRRYARF